MNQLNPKAFEKFPHLETERLILREFRESDLDDFYINRTDPDVRKYVAKPIDPNKEFTKGILMEIIRAFEEKRSLNWVIEHKQTGAFMGSAGFWRIDLENSRAEIGYSLAKKYWGQGYMTEILNKILPFVFKKVGVHSVMAIVDVENIASWKLLEKVGFAKEAHHRQDWYFNGKFYDSLVYGMLESDLNK